MNISDGKERYEHAVMLNAYLASMKAELKSLLMEQIMPVIEVEVEQAAVKAMNELAPTIRRFQDIAYDQTRLVLDLRINGEVKESKIVS